MNEFPGIVLLASPSGLVRCVLAAVLESEGFLTREVFNSFEAESALQIHEIPAALLIDAELLEPPQLSHWKPLLDSQPCLPLIVLAHGPRGSGTREVIASHDASVLDDTTDPERVVPLVRDALRVPEAA